MSRRKPKNSGVKWKQAVAYFEAHGYTIKSAGGDKLIYPPSSREVENRGKAPVRIGHNFATKHNHELAFIHLKRIEHAFGITKADILGWRG